MKICSLFALLFVLLSAFMLAMPDSSEAARFGGGRSFGSKPYMSTPAQQPRPRQQAAQTQTSQTAPRSGMLGGMGGLFGGLLAGTLLGSLLAGNGFAGGGFMDLLFMGILIFVAWKLFTRFRQSQNPTPATAGHSQGQNPFSNNMNRQDIWQSGANPGAAQPGVDVPAGFNTGEFLTGAKMFYNRMQQSWDKRDLDDIAQFTTPAVLNNLQDQLRNDPNPSHTEILLLNADLLGVEPDGEITRAQVYFDALLRESPNQAQPETVREIWHFMRVGNSGKWKLDGIQQVD